MTDQELTRLAATAIMGWKIVERISGGIMFAPEDRCQIFSDDWQPLTDWRAAGEIIEKMRADGWYCSFLSMEKGRNLCEFHKPKLFGADDGREEFFSTPTRAIVIAALRAVDAVEAMDEAEKLGA